jgi:hypothetical protein
MSMLIWARLDRSQDRAGFEVSESIRQLTLLRQILIELRESLESVRQ